MPPRRFLSVATLLVLLSLSAPVRSDPGGGDAPDHWSQAVPVLPGTHLGDVGPGDFGDWYRVEHPAGKGIRATLDAPLRNVSMHTRTSDGRVLQFGHLDASRGFSADAAGLDGVVLVGVQGSNGTSYALRLEVVDVREVELVSVRLTGAPACGHDACEGLDTHVVVEVELVNHGAVDARGFLVGTAHGDAAPWAGVSTVGSQSLVLGGHSRVVLRFGWTPTGVGNGDVTFRWLPPAGPEADAHPHNHRVSAPYASLADVPGVYL